MVREEGRIPTSRLEPTGPSSGVRVRAIVSSTAASWRNYPLDYPPVRAVRVGDWRAVHPFIVPNSHRLKTVTHQNTALGVVSQNRSLHPRSRSCLCAQRYKSNAPRLDVLVHIRRKFEATLTLPASFSPLQVVQLPPPRKVQIPMPLLFDVITLPTLTLQRLVPSAGPSAKLRFRDERPTHPHTFLPRLCPVSITSAVVECCR
jgi:hypothetical protein